MLFWQWLDAALRNMETKYGVNVGDIGWDTDVLEDMPESYHVILHGGFLAMIRATDKMVYSGYHHDHIPMIEDAKGLYAGCDKCKTG